MKNIAVVLAGGIGARTKLDTPKQLVKIAGKTILEHAVDGLHKSADIDEIIVLGPANYLNEIKKILPKSKYIKITKYIVGGKTRSETSQIAIASVGSDECNLIFQEAVRPLLSQNIIHQCVKALEEYEAIEVAVPPVDTIIEVEEGFIKEIPDRSRFMRGQTPQSFRKSVIKKAYELAKEDPDFMATDDCGVVSRYLPQIKIKVIDGEEQNIKVTYPLDFFIMDKMFQFSTMATNDLTDTEKKTRLKDKTIVIIGNSSGVGRDIAELAELYGANVVTSNRPLTGAYIAKISDIEKVLKKAKDKFGAIDYVIGADEVLLIEQLENIDESSIKNAINVNYIAPLLIAKATLPYLAKTKGQLLLFTSSSYTRGQSNYSLYSSSKAAIVNLTQALSEEWSDIGVRINCINPEREATPIRLEAFGKEDPATLLLSKTVAQKSIDTLLADITGQVIDVQKMIKYRLIDFTPTNRQT